ncbi:MAG: hypothetical protein CMH57_13885 [Myxococcales bacterium]|nr:hypothetical protein [Myxococcales bacterium]
MKLAATTAATIAVVSLLTAPGFAFEISKTEAGATVHWDTPEVVYTIHTAGTRQMSNTQAREAIIESFDTWNGHGADLHLVYGGEIANGHHGYVKNQENSNTIIWEDDSWPYDPNALALTLTSFERGSGRLVDADIIINSADYSWATDGQSGRHDLSNSLTHEVGHFIGLGHSESEHATMFPSAAPGEVLKRTLYNDDLRGLNFLYANNTQAIGSDWTDADVATESDDSGYRINDAQVHLACSTTAPGGSPRGFGAFFALGGLLLGATFFRRRRQPRHTARRSTLAVAALLVTGVVAVSSSATATTLPALTLDQVTVASERVVLVEVLDQAADFEGGVIWTHTTVRVEECWSGDCDDDTLVVRTPGGVVGDLEQRVHGVTTMRTGDRLVLFLEATPNTLGQVFRPFGMALGALRVHQLGQDTVAVRDLTDVALVNQERVAVHGDDMTFAIELDELRRLVRD